MVDTTRHRQHRPEAGTWAHEPADELETLLHTYERFTLEWEASHGITSNERRLLAWLTVPTTSNDLASASGLEHGAVAATLALLRERRLVELEWDDDEDAARSRATPTPRGLQVALDIRKTLGEMMRDGQRDAARRAVRRNDEATAELLAMASHELRTPLAAIAGFTSTLLAHGDELDGDQQRKCLAIIGTQTARLQRLVDDLHLYSRAESGHLPVNAEEVDMSVAIRQAIQDLAAPDVDVVCAARVIAKADLDHLQQMLANYLSNAIKYGAAPFTVEVERAGSSIVIAVCDRGGGVPEDLAPRLFERFERGAGHFAVPGSGLGLSIVRGLARAQGGDAWYEPNEPRGSRFCVRLPQGAPTAATC